MFRLACFHGQWQGLYRKSAAPAGKCFKAPLVRQDKPCRMQVQRAGSILLAVFCIADDRIAGTGQLDSNLMGAPCKDAHMQKACILFMADKTGTEHGFLSVSRPCVSHHAFPAVYCILAKVVAQNNGACLLPESVHPDKIFLVQGMLVP